MFHFLLVPLALTAIYASDLDINAYQSGNSLLALCESKSVADQVQCIGYLQATADEISFDHLIGRSPICMRHDVTGNQLRDVTVNYLHKHPDDRQRYAAMWLPQAFSEAWKCE